MPKTDWVTVVDSVLTRVDHALDRVRKVPRRRLSHVPDSKTGPDPFVTLPAPAQTEPADPALVPLAAEDQPLTIYGKRSCMWSGRAQRIGQDLGIPTKFIDIEAAEHRDDEARLIRETKHYETPWVFVRGKYLGAYDALAELQRLDVLEERALGLAPSGNRSRIRIEVPARQTDGGETK